MHTIHPILPRSLSFLFQAKPATSFIGSTKSVGLFILVLCVLIGTGCDSNMTDGEPRTLAGVWQGAITHVNPSLNGTLTLTITQAGDVLGGTATWRFANQAISGLLIGNAAEEGPITYTLDFGGDGMYLHEVSFSGGEMTGTWVSARSNGIRGTLSLQHQ